MPAQPSNRGAWDEFTVGSTWQDFISFQENQEYKLLPEQLDAFKSLLSDQSALVSQIAQNIVAPWLAQAEKYPDVDDDNHYPDESIVWRTVADAVKQLPEYNDRLVGLVLEIQKIQTPNYSLTNMTGFKQYWREFQSSYDDAYSKDPLRTAKRRAWLNMNLFNIKLTESGVAQLDRLDQGLNVLSTTLESAPWENFTHAEIDEAEDSDDENDADFLEWKSEQLELHDVKALNGYIAPAALWITRLGERIYNMDGETDEYDWVETKWTAQGGKNVWSKERFSFWRQRFEWIATVTALDRKTRRIADDTARYMADVQARNGNKV